MLNTQILKLHSRLRLAMAQINTTIGDLEGNTRRIVERIDEACGAGEELAGRLILMINRNEDKRRQAAPGVKIRPKAFGRDGRLPITNRFHDL